MNVFYMNIGYFLTLFQHIPISKNFENTDSFVIVTFDSIHFHTISRMCDVAFHTNDHNFVDVCTLATP